jgi:hypothetical protein
MKLSDKFFCVVLFFFLQGISQLSAQNKYSKFACYYSPNLTGEYLCNELKALSYSDEMDARDILKKILEPVGLQPNFVLQPCDSIKNCVATIGENGWRVILYDRIFLKSLASKDTLNWPALSIFAHEVLHHLNQHTHLLNDANLEKKRKMELEADEWSGRILALLGANLDQATSAINQLNYVYDDQFSTHPSKEQRLSAVERGFRAGKAQAGSRRPKLGFVIDRVILKDHTFLKLDQLTEIDSLQTEKWKLQKLTYMPDGLYGFFIKSDSTPKQTLRSAGSYQQLILQADEHKGFIQTIDKLGDQWIMLLDSSNHKGEQSIRKTGTLDLNDLNIKKATGTIISDISFENNEWILLEGKKSAGGIVDQIILKDAVFPAEQAKELRKALYVVTICKFINNQWIVVMNKFENHMPAVIQLFGYEPDIPVKEFMRLEANGYRLNSTDFDGEYWIYIMNKQLKGTYENYKSFND